MRSRLFGGSVTEHYQALLEERKDTPCSADEQRGETKPDPEVGEEA